LCPDVREREVGGGSGQVLERQVADDDVKWHERPAWLGKSAGAFRSDRMEEYERRVVGFFDRALLVGK
jgi:hypothetical protein